MRYSNQTRYGEKHIYALYFLVPSARQDPGRGGQHIHFQLKNSQDAKCHIETRQDSGRNIFMHYIFWFLMPDRIQVGPGSRFTFIFKINKTPTALQKTRQDPRRNIYLHCHLWILMPDRNQVEPGIIFTFSLKIHKTQNALKKPDMIRGETYL